MIWLSAALWLFTAAFIGQTARKHSLAVETADRMLIRQQDQIDRGDVERERLVVELAALRAELVALRKELKVERALRAESDSNFRQEIERLAAIISGGS